MDNNDQQSIRHSNNWLNDEGQPSFEKIRSLAEAGTAEAMETLREIAGRYNVSYDEDTTPKKLLDKINLALGQGSENS
jgi:hypothetical protein